MIEADLVVQGQSGSAVQSGSALHVRGRQACCRVSMQKAYRIHNLRRHLCVAQRGEQRRRKVDEKIDRYSCLTRSNSCLKGAAISSK